MRDHPEARAWRLRLRAAPRGAAAAIALALLSVQPALAMGRSVTSPDFEPREGARSTRAHERECRRQCADWLMPQCNPQTMRRGETVFECVSRLAPVFDDCVRRCRAE
jgi:hypothetical protein